MKTDQKLPLEANFTKPIIRGGDFVKDRVYLNVSASEAEASEIERDIGRSKRETYMGVTMGLFLILFVVLFAGATMVITAISIYFSQGGESALEAIIPGVITFVASAVPLALYAWFKHSLVRDKNAWEFAKHDFIRQSESHGSIVEVKIPHEIAFAEALELKFQNINSYLAILGRSDSNEVQPEMKNALEALATLVSLPKPQEVPSDIKARRGWYNPIISLFMEKITEDAKAKDVGTSNYLKALEALVDKEAVLYAESSMKKV